MFCGIKDIDIADVLLIYDNDCGDRIARTDKFNGRLERLNEFWSNRKLADNT
jgi:hypothetical protein